VIDPSDHQAAPSGLRATLILFAALLAALWTIALSWVALEHGQDLEDQTEDLRQLTSAVGGQTLGLFKVMEASVDALEYWLLHNSADSPWDDPGFTGLAKQLEGVSSGLLSFYVVDSSGGLYFLPNLGDSPKANVRDRDYFNHMGIPGARGLFIGKTVKSRITGRHVIPVAHPVEVPGGSVKAIICAIDVERIQSLNEAQRPKPGGTIALLRSDGIMLSRAPFMESLIGKDISQTPTYQENIARKPSGAYLTESTITDSVPKFVSFMHLDVFPLIVVVSASTEDALDDWKRDSFILLTLTFTASVMALLGLRKLLKVMRDNIRVREELRLLANTDELTGLLNRRALTLAARREFERSRRHARPLSVIMIDLDHFKSVNDTFGHATGDSVLRAMGEDIARCLRQEDIAGRMGGEEFCVVLPETALEEASAVAERLRGRFCRLTPLSDGTPIPCPTMSLGVAEIRRDDADFYSLLGRADMNLYTAKRLGRDRVHAG